MLWRAPVIRRDPSLAIPAVKPRGMLGDHATLELMVLLEPTPALAQPLAAVARDRHGVGLALGIQRLLGRAQPLATTPSRSATRRGSSSPRASP